MYKHNIRPKQVREIPWGWENKQVGNQVYVVKHPYKVPDICLEDYFNWNEYDVTGSVYPGDVKKYSSQDMKCLFTTVYRFLGDKLYLMMVDNFDKVEDIFEKTYQMLLGWNLRLVYELRDKVELFVIGDDVAFNTGLLIDPEIWIKLVGIRYKEMIELIRELNTNIKVIFHSDGDISKLLPYLNDEMKVNEVLYEPVGNMEMYEDVDRYERMQLITMPIYDIHLGYRRLNEDANN